MSIVRLSVVAVGLAVVFTFSQQHQIKTEQKLQDYYQLDKVQLSFVDRCQKDLKDSKLTFKKGYTSNKDERRDSCACVAYATGKEIESKRHYDFMNARFSMILVAYKANKYKGSTSSGGKEKSKSAEADMLTNFANFEKFRRKNEFTRGKSRQLTKLLEESILVCKRRSGGSPTEVKAQQKWCGSNTDQILCPTALMEFKRR